MRSEAGTLLLESGIIDENQLQRALSSSVAGGQTFVQTLVGLGYVNDNDLASFFASRLQIPLAEKSLFLRLPAFITRLIPLDIVLTHRTVPVMLHQGVLHMAMSDPTNREAIEEISFITGYSASPVAAPESLLEQAMEEYYGIPPDRRADEIKSISLEAQADLAPVFSSFSHISRSSSGGQFETVPKPVEQEAPSDLFIKNSQVPNLVEPSQSGVQTWQSQPELLTRAEAVSAPMENQSDQAALLIEPASGELAELFGLSSKDEEIIHLTRTKSSSSVSSINDAIVKKVKSVLEQDNSSKQPTTASPAPSQKNTGNKIIPEKNTADSISDPEQTADEQVNAQTPPLKDAAEAKYLIDNARERDEIASTLVEFSRAFAERVVIFIVKKDMLVGWIGAGAGIKGNQIKGIIIPLSSPSVFRTVKETLTDYFGSMPRTSTNEMFLSALGEIRPRQVLLIPITVRQKAICILYGDCGKDQGFKKDLSNIHLLAQDASNAFERIIIEKKINRLVKKQE